MVSTAGGQRLPTDFSVDGRTSSTQAHSTPSVFKSYETFTIRKYEYRGEAEIYSSTCKYEWFTCKVTTLHECCQGRALRLFSRETRALRQPRRARGATTPLACAAGEQGARVHALAWLRELKAQLSDMMSTASKEDLSKFGHVTIV